MELTKELILTLRSLSGIGPKKILTIGATIKDRGVNIDSLESLQKLMASIKDKKVQSVKLDDLEIAYKKAMDTIRYSEANEIGLIGYYDDEYPKALRKAINEEGKAGSPATSLVSW